MRSKVDFNFVSNVRSQLRCPLWRSVSDEARTLMKLISCNSPCKLYKEKQRRYACTLRSTTDMCSVCVYISIYIYIIYIYKDCCNFVANSGPCLARSIAGLTSLWYPSFPFPKKNTQVSGRVFQSTSVVPFTLDG